MANKELFKPKSSIKATDLVNKGGGIAYSLSDEASLAQLVCTGTFNNVFYSTGKEQLDKIIELCNKCDLEYVAKLAIYARTEGLMKDTPAFLTALVATKSPELLKKIFPRVINTPKMLRNYVQIIRSGTVGRKSLGSTSKKLVQKYLNSLSDDQLFKADIGNSPSLGDIIKLSHPKAKDEVKNNFYAYLLDRKYNKDILPENVKAYESFKNNTSEVVPDVDFRKLTALKLSDDNWKSIAANASWQQIRHNLNSFQKHNVFQDQKLVKKLADKLSNYEEVKRSRAFPYEIYSTFIHTRGIIPVELTNALQQAAEIAVENVQKLNKTIKVCLDISSSMRNPITGNRGSASSKMRHIDVASVITSSILRKNPDAEVVPFNTEVKKANVNGFDSIMTNAEKLAAMAGGGTKTSSALQYLNEKNAKADVVIYISDNQSWYLNCVSDHRNNDHEKHTATMEQWKIFSKRNQQAKMVLIDIAPYADTQAYDDKKIMNIGGWSDSTFQVINDFLLEEDNKNNWINFIKNAIEM